VTRRRAPRAGDAHPGGGRRTPRRRATWWLWRFTALRGAVSRHDPLSPVPCSPTRRGFGAGTATCDNADGRPRNGG